MPAHAAVPAWLATARIGLLVLVIGLVGGPPARAQEPAVPATARSAPVAQALGTWIEAERRDKQVPAVMIALVDGDRVVWAAGFGMADPERGRPATAQTVVRVGSVSKLFTDLAALQQVERGRLDLDAPITASLPELALTNPFNAGPITLRHLMAHRAGVVREPPVGNYFDPTEPGLVATIASLNRTRLIYPPGERTKYSNAGISVVGLALERATGLTYDQAIARAILEPLGMTRSSFKPGPELLAERAVGQMWTLDGRRFAAPGFDWGIAPAASLDSTVADLGTFLAFLFAEGRGPDGPILQPETLRSMFEPQFGSGFGLGFMVGSLDGSKRVSHGGAVYGFATELAALPTERLGVAVVCTQDCANALSRRIADQALRMMRAVQRAEPLPQPASSTPISAAERAALVGRYGEGVQTVTLRERDGELIVSPAPGAAEGRLRRLGERLVIDDVLSFGVEVAREGDSLRIGNRLLKKVTDRNEAPAAPPEPWRGLIGEYGWDHDVLYILEHEGKLHALIEWFFLYPLEELEPDRYRFPAYGLYDGETLQFERDASGRAARVTAAEVCFERRTIAPGVESGQPFRVTPVRPVAELRAESLQAKPPAPPAGLREPELVELTTLAPTIKLDIRYATDTNFLGTPFYDQGRAFLQRPAAKALVRAHRELATQGYGLLIHDAYRPWYVTRMFWEATRGPDRQFVANPAQGSKHNRGCAVDLTLYDLGTGEPVEMVGTYDEFSPRSAPNYPGGTSRQRWHRELLRAAMERQGFTVNVVEWWHFDFADWAKYPVLNLPFEAIGAQP